MHFIGSFSFNFVLLLLHICALINIIFTSFNKKENSIFTLQVGLEHVEVWGGIGMRKNLPPLVKEKIVLRNKPVVSKEGHIKFGCYI